MRGERGLAEEARRSAERTRAAVEQTYWLAERGFYGFATALARESVEAERGPERARRQARLEALARGGLVDEDTVMPAVPLAFGLLEDGRAQSQLDHLGAGALATDWGARLLADTSPLYDPLSYHHGSVWPLFTGWASLAAYRYGRPHVGYQHLRANADLRSAERSRLRHRAPLRRLPRRLRPLVAPPGVVRGHGRDAARARTARAGRRGRRARPELRAPATGGLGPVSG